MCHFDRISQSGVQQTSIPPRLEVVENAHTVSRLDQVRHTSDFRTVAVNQLAKHIAAGGPTCLIGVSFQEAMREYVTNARP